jgi:O-antigen/teichoic acid export membrane protein
MSFGRLSLKSSMWTLGANGGQQLLQFGFFIFMARLLEPKAFGLVAMAMVGIDFFAIVGRMGLLETLVQQKEETATLQNKVFWLLQLVGVSLAVIMALCSGLISSAYGAPELQKVIVGFSAILWIQNLGVVHEARLRRRFAFKDLAARTLTGTMVGSVIGLVLALNGFGVWSLVIQRIAMITTQIIILWITDRWRPGFAMLDRGHDHQLVTLIRNGVTLMLGQLVAIANNRMVDVIVGFFMGPVALGYLRVAWRIFDFVLQFAVYPITNVALSTFSHLRDDAARLQRAYLRLIEIGAMITQPTFFGLAAVAPLAIPLLFGEHWKAAAPLMQAMSIMAVAAVVNIFFAPLMTAAGHAKLILRQGVLQIALTVTLTAAASKFGLHAVVFAHAGRALLMALLNLRLQEKYAEVSMKKALGVIWPPFVVSLVMGAATWSIALIPAFEHLNAWLLLAMQVGAGVIVYFALIFCFFRKRVMTLIDDLLNLAGLRDAKPAVAATSAAAD